MAANARIVTMQIPEDVYNDVADYLDACVEGNHSDLEPADVLARFKREAVKLTQFVPKN